MLAAVNWYWYVFYKYEWTLGLSTDNWHWYLYSILIDLGPLLEFHTKKIGASLIGFSLKNSRTLSTKLLGKRLQQARTGKNCGFGYKRLHSEVKFKVTCWGPEAKPTSSPQSIFGWLSAQSLVGGQTKSSSKCLRQRRMFFRGWSTSSHVKPFAAATGSGDTCSSAFVRSRFIKSARAKTTTTQKWSVSSRRKSLLDKFTVQLIAIVSNLHLRGGVGTSCRSSLDSSLLRKNWMLIFHLSPPQFCPSAQKE